MVRQICRLRDSTGLKSAPEMPAVGPIYALFFGRIY
jgi:hypothetical protein